MKQVKSAIIIGSGVGGLGAACLLAKAGWQVTVLEKNDQLGGRVGTFTAEGFTFDTGPSWFLMPDVFEHFFELLGEKLEDHIRLKKLAPSYKVFYKDKGKSIDIYSDIEKDTPTVERLEPGASVQLRKYLRKAERQYAIAKEQFIYKNYDSVRDFFTLTMLREGSKLNVLSNMSSQAGKYFKSEYMQKLVQYPAVFLGTSPYEIPALYRIMNHVDFGMGVYYPEGGMYSLVRAMQEIAKKHGANLRTNCPVSKIVTDKGTAVGVVLANGREIHADTVISNAGMHHTDTQLLEPRYRSSNTAYGSKRTLAPSALLIYLGIKGQLPGLRHHNLLFSKDWKKNFAEIFNKPKWPSDPSFYVCNPSKTDKRTAPAGCENLFVLVPTGTGLAYSDKQLEDYFEKILKTMEDQMSLPGLCQRIVYKRLFSVKNFAERYNSPDGTALGLAHTLRQTAFFRPQNVNKKVKSLYYVGADTHPGIGIPPVLISAELLYKRLIGDRSSRPLHDLRA